MRFWINNEYSQYTMIFKQSFRHITNIYMKCTFFCLDNVYFQDECKKFYKISQKEIAFISWLEIQKFKL